MIASMLLSSAFAGSGTVTTCYSTAETNNSGLSVQVRLGTTVILTSNDLDAVFDKIAERHTAANLILAYNAAGEAALEEAMDCIFDAEHVTLSSIWLNENDATVSQRTNTAVFKDTGTTVDTLYFEKMFSLSGSYYIEVSSSTSKDCFKVEVSGLGTYDYFADLSTAATTRCSNVDCDEGCTGGGSELCGCDGDGGCNSITEGDDVSGDASSVMNVDI